MARGRTQAGQGATSWRQESCWITKRRSSTTLTNLSKGALFGPESRPENAVGEVVGRDWGNGRKESTCGPFSPSSSPASHLCEGNPGVPWDHVQRLPCGGLCFCSCGGLFWRIIFFGKVESKCSETTALSFSASLVVIPASKSWGRQRATAPLSWLLCFRVGGQGGLLVGFREIAVDTRCGLLNGWPAQCPFVSWGCISLPLGFLSAARWRASQTERESLLYSNLPSLGIKQGGTG